MTHRLPARSSLGRSAPVLIALPDGLSVSGVTLWATRLAGLLAADGRAVVLALHAQPGSATGSTAPPPTIPPGVRTLSLAHLPPLRDAQGDLSPFIPAYRDAMRRLAYESKSPVVYVPTLLGDSFAIGAAIALTDPELIRIVGWQHADIAYDQRILAHYEPVITAFAGVSRRITDTLRAALPGRAAGITHLPNAVPVGHAPPERVPRRGRPLRLVYAGRLELKQKRVTALVALSDELARRKIDHTLSLIGDGPAAAEVRGLADAASRKSRIILPGPLAPADLRAALRDADCFVLASRYEGLSVAMLEAMAEGCVPVVTAVASGASEVIVDALHGYLVGVSPDASDETVAGAMADAVECFLASDTREIAMQAWRRVRDDFSLDHYAPRAIELIDHAAAASARTWPADRPCAFTAGAHSSTGSGTVPPDAPRRLAELLRSLAGRRVVLHGAGRHTIELAPTLAASGAEIVGVTDDDPARWGQTLLGWPIVPPEEVGQFGASDIVISSWLHADEIFARREVYERRTLTVHHLYRDPQHPPLVPYTSSVCTN